MDRFYEDIKLPLSGFSFVGARPLLPTPEKPPTARHEVFYRMPVIGSNNIVPCYSATPGPPIYSRTRTNVNKYVIHPPVNDFQRTPYTRYSSDRSPIRAVLQPTVMRYDTRTKLNSSLKNAIGNSQHLGGQFITQGCQRSPGEPYSKKNVTPEQEQASNPEAIKKAVLAAKLKKSLEAFKKNPSCKMKNLSIINKTDTRNPAGPSKCNLEIQPCFRWDLPLTVDDLKTIRRCPSGSVTNDRPNTQEDVSIIERHEYNHNTEPLKASSTESSPDVMYVKRCRKRKSSESMESVVSKKEAIIQRRRHRSASPKLCVANNGNNDTKQCHQSQGPCPLRETMGNSSLPVAGRENSPNKEKPLQSSNVMQLLGVKRREFDELVNQPRSPRVQFMLNLLMKRHKELLLQRAMRSRISNVTTPERSSAHQEENLGPASAMESPGETSKQVKLEGMGASDTIDQLSNILLESSLAVDISSLPHELIDQIGTFLEMGAEMGNLSGGVEDLDESEQSTLMEGGVEEEYSAESGRCSVGGNRDVLHENITSDVVPAQTEDVSDVDELLSRISEYIGDEQSKSCVVNPLCVMRDNNSNATSTHKGTVPEEIEISRTADCEVNVEEVTIVSTTREEENSKHRLWKNTGKRTHVNSFSVDNTSNVNEYSQVGEGRSLNFPSTSSQPDVIIEDAAVDEFKSVITKLWTIDLKILELMEEKKKLYEQLRIWKNGKSATGNSNINSPSSRISVNEHANRGPSKRHPHLRPKTSIHIPIWPESPVSNSPSSPNRRTRATDSEDPTFRVLSRPANSESPQRFREDPQVTQEHSHHPRSPRASQNFNPQRNEDARNGATSGQSASPVQCHSELFNHDNVPLPRVKEKPTLVSSTLLSVTNSTADSVPASKDLDCSVHKSSDEPVEIVYDSNSSQTNLSKCDGELTGHSEAVLALKVIGNYLFASCSDKCVYCYDLDTHRSIQTYKGHTEAITCLHVELRGKNMQLFTGSHDKYLLQFDVKAGKIQRFRRLAEPIQCMEEGWGVLYIGTKKGNIERYSIKNGDFIRSLMSMNNEIMAIQTSTEGPRKVLIVASRNMPMVVRDATSGLLLRTINQDMLKHTTYSLHVHEGIVYAGTSTYGIAACDFTNGKVVQTYMGCGSVVSVKADHDKVYAACYNGNIYIYEKKYSSPKLVIHASEKMLLCMEQRDDTVFAGGINGKLKFWKIP